jgi:histidinol-phosphate/aromatic aminotransferase/cobyric acid decarboxylase-like protein
LPQNTNEPLQSTHVFGSNPKNPTAQQTNEPPQSTHVFGSNPKNPTGSKPTPIVSSAFKVSLLVSNLLGFIALIIRE